MIRRRRRRPVVDLSTIRRCRQDINTAQILLAYELRSAYKQGAAIRTLADAAGLTENEVRAIVTPTAPRALP